LALFLLSKWREGDFLLSLAVPKKMGYELDLCSLHTPDEAMVDSFFQCLFFFLVWG
jgi:hypothetical protein